MKDSQDSSLLEISRHVKKPKLEYPHPKLAVGDMRQLAEGVFWLRLPLPYLLNHINVWLLEDDDGHCCVVDTGLPDEVSKQIWRERLEGRVLKSIYVTHMHPDHVGLAGWMQKKWGAEFWMSLTDFLQCRVLAGDTQPNPPKESLDFYQRAGYSEQMIEKYCQGSFSFGSIVSPLPQAFSRLLDGQVHRIGGRDWEVVVGSGHTHEHACLYCRQLDMLISGDQLLPTITPNVSVWPSEPQANPLKEWLRSCQKVRDHIGEQTLVLPGHGLPFYGGRQRFNFEIDFHEQELTLLKDNLTRPLSALETLPILFGKRINDGNRSMAIGETIAHLNCLVERGDIEVIEPDAAHPAARYQRLA